MLRRKLLSMLLSKDKQTKLSAIEMNATEQHLSDNAHYGVSYNL